MFSRVSRRCVHAFVGAALATLISACGGAGGEAFRNPVHAADFPDPFVLREDGTYYAYATNAAGKEVQTLTSTDLVHWRPGRDALPIVGAWAYPGKTWAPEVLAREDGTYVLYYTANGGGQCIGRAVADRPAGRFVDRWPKPLVCQRAEGGSIDASPFRDGDGSLYLYWKNDGNCCGLRTAIYAQRLSPDGLRLLGPRATLVSNDPGWEGTTVEAPTMWREDGSYFLFYSGNAYNTESYAVGYATCRGPLGPCAEAPENPILTSACRAVGPGHQAVVRAGGDTWLVYHAWSPGQIGSVSPGRSLWLDRLEWHEGKPVVKGPSCDAQPVP